MKVEKRMFAQREGRQTWVLAKGGKQMPRAWKRREKPGSEGQLRVEGAPGAT